MDEQLVRVHLPLRNEADFDLWVELEDLLDQATQKAGAGSLDGNEIGEGEYTIWLFGPNAERLAMVVRDALRSVSLPPKSYLFLRLGGVDDLDAEERIVKLP